MRSFQKVSHLENKDYKVVQAKPRPVPSDFFVKKPFLGAIIGQRGSGKTNSFLSLVFHCDKYKLYDKMYLFCPTAFGNDPKYDLLESRPHSYEIYKYPTYTDADMKDVIEDINNDIEEYKEWKYRHDIYLKFMKHGIKRLTQKEIEYLELVDIDDDTFRVEEPECKWKQMPTSLVIFDDLVGNTELYKNTPKGILWNFVILHRHRLTSLLFICQTWTAIPRQIRANMSLLLLYNLKPEIKKDVSDELCANMKTEEFVQLWEEACVDQWDFLLVNFDEPKRIRFRQNFNNIFLL